MKTNVEDKEQTLSTVDSSSGGGGGDDDDRREGSTLLSRWSTWPMGNRADSTGSRRSSKTLGSFRLSCLSFG